VREESSLVRENSHMKHRKPRSTIEIFIQGANVVIYEHFSRQSVKHVLAKAEEEYGIEFRTKGNSKWCG
jgi:pyruvate/oxaloacetate carboxyltransferase